MLLFLLAAGIVCMFYHEQLSFMFWKCFSREQVVVNRPETKVVDVIDAKVLGFYDGDITLFMDNTRTTYKHNNKLRFLEKIYRKHIVESDSIILTARLYIRNDKIIKVEKIKSNEKAFIKLTT